MDLEPLEKLIKKLEYLKRSMQVRNKSGVSPEHDTIESQSIENEEKEEK